MGPDARVKIKNDWREPPIVWNVVLADKGQKKSAALNRFMSRIQTMEEELNHDDEINPAEEDHEERQIYIEHFSMEELHYTLKRNNGRVVGLYDEVSLLYEQLDRYKNGSSDRKTLLSLINGSPWRRNFRNSISIVPNTSFNVAGFVQPDVIVNLLHGNDYDGFTDRQFFVCPPEVDADFDEMLPMPAGLLDFKEIFHTINNKHQDHPEYTLSADAEIEYVAYHDELNERKRQEHHRNRDRKSVLSKAKGQVVRLATVSYALSQAMEDNDMWNYVIPKTHMMMAIALMNYLIGQKFALGKPTVPSLTAIEMQVDGHRVKRLLELPSPITISKISQNHIQRRVDRKYRKEEALELMVEVEKLDLGTVVEESFNAGKSQRSKKLLQKRKADDLTQKQKDCLKKMKVDLEKFSL